MHYRICQTDTSRALISDFSSAARVINELRGVLQPVVWNFYNKLIIQLVKELYRAPDKLQ